MNNLELLFNRKIHISFRYTYFVNDSMNDSVGMAKNSNG